MDTARKIKIHISAPGFRLPLPAISFSFIKWILKLVLRAMPKDNPDKKTGIGEIAKALDPGDIERIFDELAVYGPIELVNIDTEDHGQHVKVHIRTI